MLLSPAMQHPTQRFSVPRTVALLLMASAPLAMAAALYINPSLAAAARVLVAFAAVSAAFFAIRHRRRIWCRAQQHLLDPGARLARSLSGFLSYRLASWLMAIALVVVVVCWSLDAKRTRQLLIEETVREGRVSGALLPAFWSNVIFRWPEEDFAEERTHLLVTQVYFLFLNEKNALSDFDFVNAFNDRSDDAVCHVAGDLLDLLKVETTNDFVTLFRQEMPKDWREDVLDSDGHPKGAFHDFLARALVHKSKKYIGSN